MTFILTIPYNNSGIYLGGKKNRPRKKGEKRKQKSKPFSLDNIAVIIVSTLGKREYFCIFIYYKENVEAKRTVTMSNRPLTVSHSNGPNSEVSYFLLIKGVA